MAQQNQIGWHATTIRTSGGLTLVQYHSTDVVAFDAKNVWLRSGGWRTATTKTRMNQASHQFDLGYSVWQRDFSWYVTLSDGTVLNFEDGMKIPRKVA